MLSITYLSSAVERWTEDDLVQLLCQARRTNAELGLTGMLLYADGGFIQTLEGPDEAVERVIGRVLSDPRHGGVLVVHREEITERAFAEWAMGFESVSVERAQEVAGFTDYLRTGTIKGATSRRNAAMTFHRVFRETHPRSRH